MSGNSIVLDTNIILYLLNGDEYLADFLNQKELYISIISEIELLGYNQITKQEKLKIKEFISYCTILNISEKIKNECITLKEQTNIKTPDALVASTAIFLNLPLISADKIFNKIENINFLHYKL
ncbi:MAG: type II toxin-antitoxin system VapC family toxin [Flavobacteriales bacterium]|nr:type II toxin-antitoxin system VapC family toxin [Flavobacteriales bacterium]